MRVGYACLTIGVPGTKLKSIQQKNASSSALLSVIEHNLLALGKILDYNLAEGIEVFRISSDIIPFASSPVNKIFWWDDFGPELSRIGQKTNNKIRVSMHPGQYTVLNSLRDDVVISSIADLKYHARFLDILEAGPDSKIVLHIGGLFGDKKRAIDRFCHNYDSLDENIKRRLVIENDERLFNIEDALQVNEKIGIPVVFDNLHHKLNPPEKEQTDAQWIEICRETWSRHDGRQKIHYSQQAEGKRPGAHSETISAEKFIQDITLYHHELDIMLEVKDKNLSAVKCSNCLKEKGRIKGLEQEWQRYKYQVLEKSPAIYLEIRELLKEKDSYPVMDFYRLVEIADSLPENIGYMVNAAQHVWGYFKKATQQEKQQFQNKLLQLQKGRLTNRAMKLFLWRLALKYKQEYLINSLYLSRVSRNI